MLAKTIPPASQEGREVLRFFCCLLPREHYSFRSTGHVAMVRFEFQLIDVGKRMLLVTIENKRKHTKRRCDFLNMNWIFDGFGIRSALLRLAGGGHFWCRNRREDRNRRQERTTDQTRTEKDETTTIMTNEFVSKNEFLWYWDLLAV